MNMRSTMEKGQGLNEYGLLLAVIAVASLSALSLLGGNISELFSGLPNLSIQTPKASSATPVTAQASSPSVKSSEISLISAQQDTGTVPSSTLTPTSTSASTIKVSFNPETGKIVFGGVDNGSGTSTTTSGMGDSQVTQMLAQILQQMAATGVAPDGTPIPDTLRNYINSTAIRGFAIADQESGYNAGSASVDSTSLNDSYQTFSYSMNSLLSSLAKYPDLSSVTALINNYGGVISSINYYNYLGGGDNVTNKNITGVIGTPIDTSGITLDLSPALTDTNAQNIDNTSTQVPTYYTASSTSTTTTTKKGQKP
jgi:Flp pilus assembly pilin Flp